MRLPMRRKLLLTGLVLVGGGLLYADVPRTLPHRPQGRVWRSERPQGLDQTVGKVWFSIRETHGQQVLLDPLIPVQLMATRTRGQDNPPDRMMQCTVVKRALIISDGTLTAVDLTVAECPGNREYVVDHVLFEMDRKMPRPSAVLQ